MEENRYFVAITGAAGSGKTTATKIIEKMGIPVMYTDDHVREILATPPVIQVLQKHFGSYLFENGKLNYKYIGSFFDSHYEEECKFEQWFQPYYGREILKQLDKRKEKIVFVDIPMLFDKGIQEYFYAVWWIYSDFSVDRIRERNNYDKQKISNLIKSSSNRKNTANFCVIRNNESIEKLEEILHEEFNKLMEGILSQQQTDLSMKKMMNRR